MKHDKIINYLIDRAREVQLEENTTHSSRHVAAVVKHNTTLGIANNSGKKSHPLAARYGKNPEAIWPHAELAAIIEVLNKPEALRNLKNSTVYVVRVDKSGKIGNSFPCVGCRKAMKAFGISKVVFSVPEGFTWVPI